MRAKLYHTALLPRELLRPRLPALQPAFAPYRGLGALRGHWRIGRRLAGGNVDTPAMARPKRPADFAQRTDALPDSQRDAAETQ